MHAGRLGHRGGATATLTAVTDVQPTFSIDGTDVAFRDGESILTALVRAGEHPTSGGCLCFGGDCPHCVATVDGVSYVRTCQTAARRGLVVQRHPDGEAPALPIRREAAEPPPLRHVHVDMVIIGGGESGHNARRAAGSAGLDALVLDAYDGHEVVGIYDGPLVVARTDSGMMHVHADEVVVATGAAEIQPVAPGNDLIGLVTVRAAEILVEAGIDLGRAIGVGDVPDADWLRPVPGTLVRFEGAGAVRAVVVLDADGGETTHACDTVVVGLGFYPRDALARMGRGLEVSVVGDAASEPVLPPCPAAGTVCPCSGVTVEDLDEIWDRGFHEMELLKRASLAGTGTCQGGACIPHLRSFIEARGGELQPAFTARPVTRQVTMGEISAGRFHPAHPRTPLDQVHRDVGATMDRIGGWWRPWTYGDTDAEIAAVRSGVSIGDVSTLGKMVVTGPDAEAFLQKIYPTDVSTIRPGRSRYVLMLNERGYVMDDGMVCKVSDTEWVLTFTSGGASHAEMWMRDWASSGGYDVRLMNQTMSLGAINVTGPRAHELVEAVGLVDPPPWLGHSLADVAGVPCRVFRLSFTGEVSYELHHAADRSVALWRALLDAGRSLGVVPHGLDALTRLRLEKGHVLVGQDTDYDSTPRRIDHRWAVNMDSGDFVGRQALLRTDRIPLDKQLVGLEMDGVAPFEGAVIWNGDDYAGYVTSASWSDTLGKGVMLGWLDMVDGALPETVTIEGHQARRVSVPFYDPDGGRARA